jgi:pimeloyl-ACP methyl ester carboxylesterase
VIERTLAFGDGGLVGTICLPDKPRPGGVGQVLFNAGVVHRVGPHRINVRLARALARQGIASIRFDLAGMGDSPRATAGRDFESQAVVDLRSAMDELGSAADLERFALFGFCSGGVHSFAAAQADPRVAGIVLYDTYIYPTLRARLNRYRNSIRRKGFAAALGGWAARRLAPSAGAPRLGNGGADNGVSIAFHVPTREEFAKTVHALHARGVQVSVIYSGGFPEIFNYAGQFEDVFAASGITRFVTCDYLPEMDHTATLIAAQAELLRRLEAWTAALDERCRGTAR